MVFITEEDFKALTKMKQKEIYKAYEKFNKRKKIHVKDENLMDFMSQCESEFHPMLYTIPFKCYFSIYLFLFLKKHAERFDFELDSAEFTWSKPLEVNFSYIARLAKVPLNTVKKAFHELTKYEFLIYSDILTEDKHNASKSAMLVNDFCVIGHDSVTNKTLFNTKQRRYTTQL